MDALTSERLRELLHYEPATGVFTRLVQTSNRTHVGDIAGSISHYGYVEFQLAGKLRKAHRAVWLYVHGVWPAGEIDHIDGDRANNRLDNLRDVPPLSNQQNRRAPNSNNSSGFLGVSPRRGKWKAQIRTDGTNRHLGTYQTPELAYAAYLKAKRELHEGCTI